MTLVSAAGCAQSAGVGWFAAVVDQAREACPDVAIGAILDCTDATGRALQAISVGLRRLVVAADCPALPALSDLAAQAGATILTAPPDAIDLAAVADVHAACRAAFGLAPAS
ncbi:MAG: hypothetical protein R3F55_20625 [Alphaproteobacteria bacterium]